MNSRHRNIQFTCEVESNDKISVLDISITRSNNKLVTSLYQKKTFSGVYMNYTSFLPHNCKKGLIDTDYSILHNDIIYSKTTWQKNLFPFFFIDNCI